MYQGQTVFSQLMEYLPRHTFRRCVNRYNGNYRLLTVGTMRSLMVGKPTIRGTRLTVEFILNLLAHGTTIEKILDEYEGLTKEDIQACLLFATRSLEDTTFMPLTETA